MKLLIVNLHFDIGGVEVMLSKLIPLLAKKNVEITLLLLTNRMNDELVRAVAGSCKILQLTALFPYTRSRIDTAFGSNFDVVMYTVNRAFLLGSWLLGKATNQSPHLILAAYQTELFCSYDGWWCFHQIIMKRKIRRNLTPRDFIFVNDAGRDHHGSALKMDLTGASVITLLVDIDKYSFVDRRDVPKKKIVSIGRITSFKTYNFTMLNVMKSLTEKGYDLEWHVYGDGEQFATLKRQVASMQLERVVKLYGAIPYSALEGVLRDSFLYIGSGTSLIDAAACGVPAITTIEYSNDASSYGFISDVPGYSLIEPDLPFPKKNIEELIVDVFNSDNESYYDLQIKCFEKAKLYGGGKISCEYFLKFQSIKSNGRSVKTNFFEVLASVAGLMINRLINRKKFS